MAQLHSIVRLFEERPRQWGLRGDPHLWDEMGVFLADTPAPKTPDALASLIEETFQRLTGYALFTPDPFYVERLNHGGMSGGYVDPRFWRETVIPLFQQRLFGAAPRNSRDD